MISNAMRIVVLGRDLTEEGLMFCLLCEHCVLIVYHSIDVKIEEPYWPLLLVAAAGEKFPLWRR